MAPPSIRGSAHDHSKPPQRCWISLGSNQDRERSLRSAVAALRQELGPVILSPVYESEAEGFDGAPFLNLVAGVDTRRSVGELRALLRRIESDNGRVRGGERFAPRTLDLDLLTWGHLAGEVDGYRLPRDEILRYAFVLGPLADVAPDERHPTDGRTYAELWAERGPGWAPLRPYRLDF
jgi:2-amino-4-hydroxy-6-hydroxymethyldihydropteridine diphosphokinase